VSSKTPVGYVDIRVFAHATEDLAKVSTAVRNTLPEEIGENTLFQKTTLTGHHRNPNHRQKSATANSHKNRRKLKLARQGNIKQRNETALGKTQPVLEV
jgi:RNA binding exosome subunit